jgi:hypothetical protein
VLLKGGQPVRLIPRYFDLLLLLVDERRRAVTRQEIFDRVWTDVVVSDGALTQAIRTIRRTLGDGPHTAQFIRTVSRHGYQFVYLDVVAEPDEGALPGDRNGAGPVAPVPPGIAESPRASAPDRRDVLLAVLLRDPPYAEATEDERFDAAIALHELGTQETLLRLGSRTGHEEARAILREARWDAAGAGEVPLLRAQGRITAIVDVVALRLRRAARLLSVRWFSATLCGALAGALAGGVGGIALGLVPNARVDPGVVLALAIIGTVAGAFGAGGIGGGLAAAEALARSKRAVALTVAGAFGGLVAGTMAHITARALLAHVFGHDVPELGGAAEGLALGGVLGCGYGLATRQLAQGGMAAPRGASRWRVAIITGLLTAATGVGLAAGGRYLVGASLDIVANVFAGSAVGLDPLARLLGEGSLRPMTRMIVSGFEAFMLGVGVSYGLTYRPRR